MYEIIRVGIPIRTCDITETFLDIVKEIKTSSECIAITTVDYDGDVNTNGDVISSYAGHEILFNNISFERPLKELNYNVINTLGYIWDVKNENGKHRDGPTLVKFLYDILDTSHNSLKFKKVYVLTSGSPHHYDLFTAFGKDIRPLSIVDTYSSITITKEAFEKEHNKPVVVRNYIPDFIEGKNKTLTLNCINLFGSISNNYKPDIDMPVIQHFFESLKVLLEDNDLFMYCYVSRDGAEMKTMTFKDALKNIEYFSTLKLLLTYGVYKQNV
jgi:hypothetical protein